MGGILAGIIRVFLRNPTIIFCIGLAAYYMTKFNINVVLLIFQTFVPYAIMYGIAFFYVMLVKHIYKPNSKTVDWWATFMSSFTQFFSILIATALTCVIIFAYNYAFTDKLDAYLRYEKQ